MILDSKADILYVIMGTNPFPNLISAITRVKPEGNIVCICTDSTKDKPYNRFKKVVQSKIKSIKIEYIIVDGFNRNSINEKIAKDLELRINMVNHELFIELNYTGGTKIMASAAYDTFCNYEYSKYEFKPNIILSHIDPERERLYYEFKKSNEDIFKKDSIALKGINTDYKYTVLDIINTYNIDLSNEEKLTKEVKRKDIVTEIARLFCNIDKNTYHKHIEFVREINNIFNDIKNNNKRMMSDQQIFKFRMNSLLEKMPLPLKYKNCDDFGFQNDKELYDYFKNTKWLEEYIFSIFLELKEEGIIDDVIGNYEKINRNGNVVSDENVFEVDVVAYKKYKLYAVSITSSSKKDNVWGKLFEIKQRAKDLAGDEAGMCYINLCWDTDFLKNEVKNIWDNVEPKNLLIIGAKDFGNIKEKLRSWIIGE